MENLSAIQDLEQKVQVEGTSEQIGLDYIIEVLQMPEDIDQRVHIICNNGQRQYLIYVLQQQLGAARKHKTLIKKSELDF
mmetsp:Transcript_14541/g.22585  ORF Transcript_14541/g.22585 Transcript_14541/m.22585 type:complete len:80 (+) Transcript_14541:938-1177(+)